MPLPILALAVALLSARMDRRPPAIAYAGPVGEVV